MSALIWNEPPTKLLISRSELHIWRIDLDTLEPIPKDFTLLLSSEEIKRLERFVFERDRYRYQATHGMKRLILAHYLDCEPQDLCFEIASQGKPVLANVSNALNIQFNISHSRDLILIATTAEDSVGIDIEYQDKKISIEGLSEIIFSPLEKRFFSSLKSQQERSEAFFRCWTRKEAYLKAKAIGLTVDLTRISVDLNEMVTPLGWLKISTVDQTELLEWKLFLLNMGSFYTAAAVATSFQKYLFTYDAKCLLKNSKII